MNTVKTTSPVEIVILTFQRDDILPTQAARLKLLHTKNPRFGVILIDNNADEIERSSFFNNGGYPFTVLQPNVNSGVAGGRNLGIKSSSSDILIFWDDDALVDSNFPIDQLIVQFSERPSLGVIAFRSINPLTGKIDKQEFPHTDKSRITSTLPFNTFRYIGVGHAIRRSAIDIAGWYDGSFFYGMEEFDESFRILDAGFEIIYDPKFSLEHHKHSSGRLIPRTKWINSYSNKLKVAYKNLPLRHNIAVAMVWFIFIAIKTKSLSAPIIGLGNFRRWIHTTKPKRKPIKKETLKYIKKCGGNPYV